MKLDLTLTTADERSAYINNFFKDNPLFLPTQAQLDLISNYLLYGKEPIDKHGNPTDDPSKFTNPSTRKEIDIQTKYNSWKQKAPVSLDEALECPSFSETAIQSHPLRTKQYRPTISRELESDIPTIDNLWGAIDHYADKLKNESLTSAQRYGLRHMIIEMRREQFTLKDIFKPTLQSATARRPSGLVEDEVVDWENAEHLYSFLPMGLYKKGDLRFEAPLALTNINDDWKCDWNAEHTFDFCKSDNIAHLISLRQDLEGFIHDNPGAAQKGIIDTLDYYIDNTDLNEIQALIIHLKGYQIVNKDIATIVNRKFNKTYNPNYISTIYRKACDAIATTAERKYLYYYDRFNPDMYKKCKCCGQIKYKDSFEFTRKSRNADGFNPKCKECEKKK